MLTVSVANGWVAVLGLCQDAYFLKVGTAALLGKGGDINDGDQLALHVAAAASVFNDRFQATLEADNEAWHVEHARWTSKQAPYQIRAKCGFVFGRQRCKAQAEICDLHGERQRLRTDRDAWRGEAGAVSAGPRCLLAPTMACRSLVHPPQRCVCTQLKEELRAANEECDAAFKRIRHLEEVLQAERREVARLRCRLGLVDEVRVRALAECLPVCCAKSQQGVATCCPVQTPRDATAPGCMHCNCCQHTALVHFGGPMLPRNGPNLLGSVTQHLQTICGRH
jgi:hypothetical protein